MLECYYSSLVDIFAVRLRNLCSLAISSFNVVVKPKTLKMERCGVSMLAEIAARICGDIVRGLLPSLAPREVLLSSVGLLIPWAELRMMVKTRIFCCRLQHRPYIAAEEAVAMLGTTLDCSVELLSYFCCNWCLLKISRADVFSLLPFALDAWMLICWMRSGASGEWEVGLLSFADLGWADGLIWCIGSMLVVSSWCFADPGELEFFSNRAAAYWSVEQVNLGRSASFVTHQQMLGSATYQAFSRKANLQHTTVAAYQATPVEQQIR
ncbi:hypothetical protein Nepgr_017442 [Nepenthes gracilis]|uniref:Uncharacterized protein n=1 Tax=Nepenthes gracilis TaxID=150966 RepID=A0AAD3XTC8_NEPGR|nr:hypothetical protein Nepgr_017442 [Nepenthes gracilis]